MNHSQAPQYPHTIAMVHDEEAQPHLHVAFGYFWNHDGSKDNSSPKRLSSETSIGLARLLAQRWQADLRLYSLRDTAMGDGYRAAYTMVREGA